MPQTIQNTVLEAQVAIENIPPIENNWAVFAITYGENILRHDHDIYSEQALNRHVQKLNTFF